MKIKVSIVDDHKVVTDGLRVILNGEHDIEVLNVANSGEAALAQLKNGGVPHVMVLDYGLYGSSGEQMNGLKTAEYILDGYPEVKILMLTMHQSLDFIVPCISAGVQGYMLKSEKNGDVAQAIRHLHLYGHYFSPEVAKDLALNSKKFNNDRFIVTDREQEVLNLLFEGYTTKEIAEKLFLSYHTVESHRKNLIQKFGAKNSVHLIYLSLKKGYLAVS